MGNQKKVSVSTEGPAAVSSLADLLRARGLQVARDQAVSGERPAPAAAEPGAAELSRCGKLVVRRERKGHGGKTVTIVDGLGLPAARLEQLARALRTAMGCGARVDGGRVVVQGDLTQAVEGWLRKRGARQVVIGN